MTDPSHEVAIWNRIHKQGVFLPKSMHSNVLTEAGRKFSVISLRGLSNIHTHGGHNFLNLKKSTFEIK